MIRKQKGRKLKQEGEKVKKGTYKREIVKTGTVWRKSAEEKEQRAGGCELYADL